MKKLMLVTYCVLLSVCGWAQQFHTADQDCDGLITVSELLRVIQFFNSAGYHCELGTEDDYAPGPGDTYCAPHGSDYNPQDWEVNLSELLRVIQFFNSGGYHTDCASEDAYGAGPGSHEVCDFETETIMLPGGVPLIMKRIPAGSFMMGRNPGEQDSYDVEDPQHLVTFSSEFWMGKYEVTQAQWAAVMGSNPSTILGDNLPVINVSWNDEHTFITTLNGLTGLTFRLPSESEWEYACRAGTTTRFYWGDDPDYSDMVDYVSILTDMHNPIHPVGEKLPNDWGLYDMCGNVYESCEDDWHVDYTGAPTDGSAWVDSIKGTTRVLRGGSWIDWPYYLRSASRYVCSTVVTGTGYGFRLAR